MKPINKSNVTDRREGFAEISIPTDRGFMVDSDWRGAVGWKHGKQI